MVETRAQAIANERIDKIENYVNSLQTAVDKIALNLQGMSDHIELELKGMSNQIQEAFSKGKKPAHEEAYNGHEYHEGESSHSHHVWHTHPPPSQRPPKLDMHKFDGSHTSAWLAQMEQYFQLNHIIDEGTKLMVGTMYLYSERWQWKEWY